VEIREIEISVFILRPPNASKTADFRGQKGWRAEQLTRGT
jgi:hypothetical protein